ncbi:MAG: FtsX-like permease family protein, partial [Bacteroidota bacterium]
FLFAIISILISGIGLFNISLFTMVQRTKEIGVRKTLGASSIQIGWLLIKDYLALILIGSAIALPLGYYFGQQWLSDFIYRIVVGPWYFGASVSIVLLISIVTIGFYTQKATRIDPVKAIKNVS